MKILAIIAGFIYLFWLYYKHIVVYIQEEMKQAKNEMTPYNIMKPENIKEPECKKGTDSKQENKVLIENDILEEIKEYQNQPSRVSN
jgi:hypothetical protein